MTKDEIKKALECCTTYEPNVCQKCPYCGIEDCRDALVEGVFALIAEQEKEIEQLKSENEQFRKSRILGNNVTVEFLDDAVSEPFADCKDIEKYAKQFRNRIISINEKEIKQAKIDALNELKTHSYYDDDYMAGYVLTDDIDEMIEELEK